MSKGHSLQDPYLNALRKERIPVSIFLVNGIKLQGQIESFDQFVIFPILPPAFQRIPTRGLVAAGVCFYDPHHVFTPELMPIV